MEIRSYYNIQWCIDKWGAVTASGTVYYRSELLAMLKQTPGNENAWAAFLMIERLTHETRWGTFRAREAQRTHHKIAVYLPAKGMPE